MRRKTTRYYLDVDTTEAEETLVDTEELMQRLENGVGSIRKTFQKAFEAMGKETQMYVQAFKVAVNKTTESVRSDFQGVQDTVVQSTTPITNMLIPALELAAQKTVGVVQGVGAMLSSMMGITAVTKKIEETTKAEEALKKVSVSAASAAKRSLAGFDQINRLDRPGGRVSYTTQSLKKAASTVPPQLQAIVDKIMFLLEPLRKIDFTPLKTSLEKLGTALSGLGGIVSKSLQWAWFEILVPLGTWVIQAAGPVAVDVLTAAFKALCAVLEPVLIGIRSIKSHLEPVVSFIGETVIMALEALQVQFGKVAQVFGEKGQKIQETFTLIGQIISILWEKMQPLLEKMRSSWLGTIDTVGSSISQTVGTAIDSFSGLVQFISGALTGDWETAWEGLKTIFRGFGNGVIGSLNGLIKGIVSGINAIIRGMNQIKFTLPGWDVLGRLAGKSYGLSLRTITAPQIPYLAKGAVLPANRPFLAMVGDQRHGTNVEAPLATIQEAVALVMDDMIESNIAGQEKIAGVLQELLSAVLDIQVGDEVIGRAAQRYNRKMAVVKGGYV